MNSIAANAAVAIENARLYLLAIEKGRLDRKLQLARGVQTHLLPASPPQVAGWDFASGRQPARQVAGDFFDFIFSPDGKRLHIIIADVSDKGMPAALYMALTRSIVRACLARSASAPASAGAEAAECIDTANRLIYADTAQGMFVSLFYACLDLASGEVTYVNAGHNPPLFYAAASGQLERLTRTGMVLGVDETALYTQATLRLAPGDMLLLYTDGVTEAYNPARDEFGEERLQQFLLDHAHLPAGALLTLLQQTLTDFIHAGEPHDDITLVALQRKI